jgi:hypothetical protein
MSHGNAVRYDRATKDRNQMPESLESDCADAVPDPKIGDSVEVDKWRGCAGNRRNLSLPAWYAFYLRRGRGFIGHDGTPYRFDTNQECWGPPHESSASGDAAP